MGLVVCIFFKCNGRLVSMCRLGLEKTEEHVFFYFGNS